MIDPYEFIAALFGSSAGLVWLRLGLVHVDVSGFTLASATSRGSDILLRLVFMISVLNSTVSFFMAFVTGAINFSYDIFGGI
jgi:hypothetical protein